jgi:hypothetical protein
MGGAGPLRHYASLQTCGGLSGWQSRAPPWPTRYNGRGRRQLVHTRLATVTDRRAAHRLEVDLNRLPYTFAQAPPPMTSLGGLDHKFSLVNEACARLFGRRDCNQLLGRPIRSVFPELAGQAFTELMTVYHRPRESALAPVHEW